MASWQPPEPVLPGKVLTVVIRDDGPMVHCGDSPSYRSVQIDLTEEQRQKLALRWIRRDGMGDDQYESISQCFIEPNEGGK